MKIVVQLNTNGVKLCNYSQRNAVFLSQLFIFIPNYFNSTKMKSVNQRLFNCKDEELPVVLKAVAFAFRRDLADFSAFSPTFIEAYATDFETRVTTVCDLLEPQSETLAKSIITERYTNTMTGLIQPINRVTGYLNLAKKNLNITPTAFGLTALRQSIRFHNVEGVIDNLHVVLENIRTYKTPLAEKGLTDEQIAFLTAAFSTMATDKQQQIEITSHRRAIVQDNVLLLNEAYRQAAEISSIGKILYKSSNPAKLADYTFTRILKNVKQTGRKSSADDNTTLPTEK